MENSFRASFSERIGNGVRAGNAGLAEATGIGIKAALFLDISVHDLLRVLHAAVFIMSLFTEGIYGASPDTGSAVATVEVKTPVVMVMIRSW